MINQLRDKQGKEIDPKTARTLSKGSLSMKEGKELQKWYKRETGIEDKDNCMCHPGDRIKIRDIILEYLNGIN